MKDGDAFAKYDTGCDRHYWYPLSRAIAHDERAVSGTPAMRRSLVS
jgi:hypothetical protein